MIIAASEHFLTFSEREIYELKVVVHEKIKKFSLLSILIYVFVRFFQQLQRLLCPRRSAACFDGIHTRWLFGATDTKQGGISFARYENSFSIRNCQRNEICPRMWRLSS